jgi:glycosyltransferase involved in cell wall biosynthesis
VTQFRIAALIPTYDNPRTLRGVVEEVRRHLKDVLIVDDGSGPEGRAACDTLAAEGLALVVHRERNGGKGAAVKTGLTELKARGFSHAFQVDADGQHAIADMPRFLAAAESHPDALILGSPEFDRSAPRARLLGRKITRFWTHVETLGPLIDDAMCGFRVYPIATALEVSARGNAMDFDPEIAVRIAWSGTPVLNLLTRVRYLGAGDGGVSHFRLVRDNALISWMHTRLVLALFGRLMLRRVFVRRGTS